MYILYILRSLIRQLLQIFITFQLFFKYLSSFSLFVSDIHINISHFFTLCLNILLFISHCVFLEIFQSNLLSFFFRPFFAHFWALWSQKIIDSFSELTKVTIDPRSEPVSYITSNYNTFDQVSFKQYFNQQRPECLSKKDSQFFFW